MIKVGIVGASGYTGEELLRLLSVHPSAEVVIATARAAAGKKVSSVHENLKGICDLTFEEPDYEKIKTECDIVFMAVPHGTAMDAVPEILKDSKCKVIDLSADYRLKTDVFEEVYAMKHKAPIDAVYAIPEVHPEVNHDLKDRLIANPGCFPTGATLAAAPLAAAGLLKSVIFDSKTGVTGAGNTPSATSHYPNLAENIIPYKLTAHRHLAEMVQEVSRLQPGFENVSFTPHVIPVARGILTTAHIETTEKLTTADVRKIYEDYYDGKPFVQFAETVPSLANVRGSNFCHIGMEADARNNRVVVLSAIDNLVKGASGQAIQNMNLICGLKETDGLWFPGLI
ncbi:N-acetyl-gamma-glutamyl-phosphate reductase [Methanimicrococcus stummii]|uniref:N-acetyl-gamma-glutamyl-phosphate reductase n=1 Tax=Methanimicrococcus stummii TaxID=3028294 RepID=A0AA96V9B5_9EURY|nr:N-acetyl-gamma-glutamyl-phosphate reductase [Methanimicrococcus sp. Es2]WNY28256.1 N-acetyl-gamma-glutamyl-phosphate reductase [Methanimicrococcus sp. Es2]